MSEEAKTIQNDSDLRNMPKIMIIGAGGAGTNMVDRLALDEFPGILTAAINTDVQALEESGCTQKLLIGSTVTRGLGTGGEIDIGRASAEADREKLTALIDDMDLIVLVVGLGGGTGSAVAATIAEVASKTRALVLSFATVPFSFEGPRRKQIASECLNELRKRAHGLVVLPNDILLQEGEEDFSVMNAFSIADNWVGRGIHSLCTLLLKKGFINQDFGSLRSVFKGKGGKTIFGIGFAEGDNYIAKALENLWLCPLLHYGDRPIRLDRILVNLIGGADLSLTKVNEVMSLISKHFGLRDDVIFGTVIDPTRKESLEICVLGKAEMETGTTVSSPVESQVKAVQESNTARMVHQSKLSTRKQTIEDKQDEFSFNQIGAQRGYFEKTDRNEYQGEDLDVPTYLRRGIRIKLKV